MLAQPLISHMSIRIAAWPFDFGPMGVTLTAHISLRYHQLEVMSAGRSSHLETALVLPHERSDLLLPRLHDQDVACARAASGSTPCMTGTRAATPCGQPAHRPCFRKEFDAIHVTAQRTATVVSSCPCGYSHLRNVNIARGGRAHGW